jgi:23S rRNA (pseudouridine1915-N3)-methyltransferase
MRIRVAYVGKPRSAPLNHAAAEYARRIGRFCDFEQQELKSAEQVTEKFPRAALLALDPAGREMDSTAFARWIERQQTAGPRDLVFLVGGTEGLPRAIRDGAELFSLSRMTLPHELARVVLLEQIYRAFTIIHNHPYPR